VQRQRLVARAAIGEPAIQPGLAELRRRRERAGQRLGASGLLGQAQSHRQLQFEEGAVDVLVAGLVWSNASSSASPARACATPSVPKPSALAAIALR
jgi:hypothetical protein